MGWEGQSLKELGNNPEGARDPGQLQHRKPPYLSLFICAVGIRHLSPPPPTPRPGWKVNERAQGEVRVLSYSLPIQGSKGGAGGGLRRQGWGALSPLFSMHKEIQSPLPDLM